MEIAITTSSADSSSFVWDLFTGTTIFTIKNNLSETNCTSLLGSDYIISIQNSRNSLYIWNWRAEQPILRFSAIEKLTCITGTKEGDYCVAGGISGFIYVWSTFTGNLISMFKGHFQSLKVVKFTEDDSFLISGGEDGLICVWSILNILDKTSGNEASPIQTWSDHSLPISCIHCGIGSIRSMIVSTSLDRTAKFWSLSRKELLGSIVFPCSLLSCVVNPTEDFLFVGGSDGNIYKTKIDSTFNADFQTFQGHKQSVNSLSISFDGSFLLSGSVDGNCSVWDIVTGQILNNFTQHKGSVSNVLVTMKPIDLYPNLEKQNTKQIQNFNKQIKTNNTETISIKQSISENKTPKKKSMISGAQLNNIPGSLNSNKEQKTTSDLEIQIESLTQENQRWKELNNTLYEFIQDPNRVLNEKLD